MEILGHCSELLAQGRNLVLVTVAKAGKGTPGKEGFKLILTDQEELYGTVGGGAIEHRAIQDAREVLKSRANRLQDYRLAELGMKCGGQVTLLFEYLEGERTFLLFGGGHINRALAPILESLGFRVTVFDSRAEVRELLPPSAQRNVVIGDYTDLSPLEEVLKHCELCSIATHGHEHDYVVLKQVLQSRSSFRYIGLIGSGRKIRTTLQKLEADGLKAPECFYAPVGLRIGSENPAEIAVSVAAEVIAVLKGAEVQHMRSVPQARES